ncbi:hypothetical protein [Kitasatospora sp. NPDC058218]|uniref:hypothetical protein n=1 Tax=Kitasatospora sp. NPDC058218 TaxID=3346385 RepID=UPI0036DA499D
MSGAQVQILLFRSAFMQGVGRFRRDAGAAFLLFRQVAGAVRSHHIAISPWVVLDRAIWQISEGLGNTFAERSAQAGTSAGPVATARPCTTSPPRPQQDALPLWIGVGGRPPHMVNNSVELLATEVAPTIRKETGQS